jgi:hypothetical protein
MTKFLEPTPEENAYHAGWTAFFDERYDKIPGENPYDKITEKTLFESWENGWRSAETVATSLSD